jgi:putative hemolysin
MTIDVEALLEERITAKWLINNSVIKKVVILFLKKILYVNKINNFIEKHSYLNTDQFVNEIFEEINFSYSISNKDIQKIPSEGKLICVANHPIGSLDALSLLKTFLEIRKDVKIVANDVLYKIEKINNHLIPFKLDCPSAQKQSIALIKEALIEECAVVFFPAGTVSRLKGIKIEDSKWHKGAVYFAKVMNAPILPVFIEARNSILFYLISLISKRFSTLFLVHELFNKKNKIIKIHIGNIIPAKAFTSSLIDDFQQTKLLRKHVNLIGKNKKGVYITEKNVISPIDRKLIQKELNNSELLGFTHDSMRIYLTTKASSPETLNEIARLREITFRKVGEGTGKKLDLDKFDEHYHHLIVWDEKDLEIVGAYRIGSEREILVHKGIEGFYTSTLFNFSKNMVKDYLPDSIELGRSFVQKKYWNTNALNYLWQGIGSYLTNDSSVKYLFGGVSISNNYPLPVQEQIVYYFSKWFGSKMHLAESKRKFVISENYSRELNSVFSGTNAKEDYRILKNLLKHTGYSVPVLYKHYSDLCLEGGVKFLDFGIDPSFENCIDGLMFVDVNLIREEKRQKFMNPNITQKLKVSA